MHIEKGAELGRGILALHPLVQGLEIGTHGGQRCIEAGEFCLNLSGRDVVVSHLQRRMRYQLRSRNGDSRGGGDAVQHERYLACRCCWLGWFGDGVHRTMLAIGAALAVRLRPPAFLMAAQIAGVAAP